ncbi:hypothetical protein INT45_011690 [Circinella minor]|uniref:Major facilitator superfamily (MFS) profile domain-containing protein n=1 Tax=Circinella minor TaxID=1195481 RepID=A0A8H7VRG9_9FUNG|nr:hypothetical protein INT45_011690 [Circinella minor]
MEENTKIINDTEEHKQEGQSDYVSTNEMKTLGINKSCKQEQEDDLIETIVFEGKELRRLLYKLDFRILPLISICYMFSFMDRVNIGNAKVAGLTDMIAVTEDDYNTALSIFFLGYVLFDIPSNVILNKLGPRLWISIIIVLCGGVLMAMAAVKNGPQLIIARFFLGVAECGFVPAMFFYISVWYTKAEMTKRIAIVMSCNVIASIFGGLLVNTIQGLRNWQWIFIIEGALTAVVGIVLFIFLPDFPEKDASFLNERERIIHRNHMAAAINTPSYYIFEGEKQQFDKLSKEFILLAFKDYFVYVYGFINFCGGVLLYNNSTFLPSIVHGMGFSSLNAQLMIIPPSAIAAIVTIIIAFNADRTRERGFHIFGMSLIPVLGYALLIGLKDKGTPPLYIAVILVTTGGIAVNTCVISWFVCNMAGRAKRSTATAILVTCGNIAGALSGQIYRASDAPQYIRGHTTSLALISCSAITSIIMKIVLRKENERRDSMSIEERHDIFAKKDPNKLGDKHPDFRYLT